MYNEELIKVESVSKKFCRHLKKSLWYGISDIAGELFVNDKSKKKLRPGEFWANSNISFQLNRGQCLGLIGRNGAGKSTLLKMLNGLIKPDHGKITIKGRVGAIIELGSGFNPILTGRENIYINGSVLGFSKKEIDNKLNTIIEFAELADFIDMPLQNYSSGMKVRLGFAVAAQMEPDVLLIDEVLAVGDIGYRAKCFNMINEIAKNTAVIFVSHAMPQVARISSHILLMDAGELSYFNNDVPQGIEHYYDMFDSEKMTISGNGKAELHDIQLYSDKRYSSKHETIKIGYLDDLFIELQFSIHPSIKKVRIYFAFFDKELRNIAQLTSLNQGVEFNNTGEVQKAKVRIPKLPFSPGNYTLTVGFKESTAEGWGEHLARYQAAKKISVVGIAAGSDAPILLVGEWSEDS